MINQSDPLIIQNLIVRNGASQGGGIYWRVPSGSPGPQVINNTIANNDASRGSAIFGDGFDSQVLVANNVLYSFAPSAVECNSGSDPAPVFVSNNVFSGNATPFGDFCGTPPASNQSRNPRFVDTPAGDYHLRRNSPSVDAGEPNVPVVLDRDLDNKARVQDGNGDGAVVIDQGAYERSAAATP